MRKLFFVSAVWLYIFFLLGLILHTSEEKHILGKYHMLYFLCIVGAFVGFYPYLAFIKYLTLPATVHVKKRKITIRPWQKGVFVLFLTVAVMVFIEVFMRVNNIESKKSEYDIDNFHPFLQSRVVKKPDSKDHINSFGFRSDEIRREKPENTYRIVILGGSTAYGMGVPYEKTAPKLLEDMLQKRYAKNIEVLNAGVLGYTSQHSVIDYMFRIQHFAPDLVIMWHGVNDMYASCPQYAFSRPYAPDYSHLFGPLTNMVAAYYSPPLVSIHLRSFDYLFSFLQTYLYSDLGYFSKKLSTYKAAQIPSVPMSFPSSESYQRNLTYLINLTQAEGTPLIFGNQPNMYRTAVKYHMELGTLICYNGKEQMDVASQIKGIAFFNDITKTVAQNHTIPFIDLDASLPKRPEYFLDVVHWSEKGHALAAQKLYEFIVSGDYVTGAEKIPQ